ncbi:hypothetical protein F4811DRAFT_446873 [Daldinia bambusicola]|nr:hypothetical protein F4811DRAFT_446873 [Daldinia bambusicola]
MYSIIALNKGKMCSPVEFRAEHGRYRRKLACKACRLGRTKCSGAFDDRPCTRCKRLGKSCVYENNKTQGRRCGSNSPETRSEGSSEDAELVGVAPPEQDYPNINSPGTSSSSPMGSPNGDTPQFVPDDSLGFDFKYLAQLQDTSSMNMFASHSELVAPLPQMEFLDPLFLFSSHTHKLQQNNKTYETPVPPLAVAVGRERNIRTGYELISSEPLFDFQNRTYDARGPSSCQYKCLHALTSSLSSLRSWIGSNRGSQYPEMGVGDVPLTYAAKAEDVLALFEKSMAQLQAAENCPLACVLSRDLSILLLLVVEQLANLLLSLAESSLGNTLRKLPCGSSHYHHHQGHGGDGGGSIQLARIGTFEITNLQDLQMSTKLLLQIRAQVLDAYICRWSDKVRHYGLGNLEADLRRIREDLGRVAFLDIYASQCFPVTCPVDISTFI